MKQNRRSKFNHKKAKTVLRLPDLELAKQLSSTASPVSMLSAGIVTRLTSSSSGIVQSPVLHSTGSWFSDTGPTLRPGNLLQALSTAVRGSGLAYEAADGGLLSSDLAAGIRRVKGVKRLGVRLGLSSNGLEAGLNRPMSRITSLKAVSEKLYSLPVGFSSGGGAPLPAQILAGQRRGRTPGSYDSLYPTFCLAAQARN
jgi:hypothetical protein